MTPETVINTKVTRQAHPVAADSQEAQAVKVVTRA